MRDFECCEPGGVCALEREAARLADDWKYCERCSRPHVGVDACERCLHLCGWDCPQRLLALAARPEVSPAFAFPGHRASKSVAEVVEMWVQGYATECDADELAIARGPLARIVEVVR